MRTLQLLIFSLLLLSSTVFASNPQVIIKTNFGNVTLELYPEKAPQTVENFLGYVADEFYKDTIFHRVIPNFMVQGGGFDTTYKEKTTKAPIENEANNGLKNEIGTIAMARTSNIHSATAQFFINVSNNAFLNFTAPSQRGYGYAVFGKVIDGMDVMNKIAKTPTGSGGPFPRDVPKSTIIIENIELISTTTQSPE